MESRPKQLVDFNSDEQRQVAVQPGGELILSGIDFDDASIDIIDTDVLVTNPDTGEQLVLMGLAIFLFDEEEVPLISFDGLIISPNLLLSKVGEIGNLTAQEFVAVSSLLEESFKTGDSEEESESEAEAVSEVLAAITEAIAAMNQAQAAQSQDVDKAKDDGKYDRKAVDEEGDTFLVAQSTARPESPALAAASEAPEVPAAEVLFDLILLQPGRTESVQNSDGIESRQILGGGGSEEAGFNPENDAQFSTEVLNYGTATDDLVIQTDNPSLFDENTMSRVIEMTPTFPAGFSVVEIRVSGFPDGFDIEGATKVGNDWIIESPEINARGSLRVNLIYSVPSDETFSVDFSVTSEFEEGAVDQDGIELAVPSETSMVSEDSREFIVQEVLSADDLNFINSDGAEVWVLAINPNPNRVFSGSGNDQITGSVGVDFVQGGAGDDIIDGRAGNDVLNGEGGDDRLLHNEGMDRFTGGAGVDTLDYSELIVPVNADLSVLVDGFANVLVDADGPTSEIDEVSTIENIVTGSANDNLTGDAEDNLLSSGSGNDRLVGGGGNDVLDGGADRDIADYSASTGPITTNLVLDTDNVYVDESNIDTLIDIEHVVGSAFDDDLTGGAGDDTFEAGAGNDKLSGGAGSDTLDGGDGERDVAVFTGIDAGVQVNLGGSTDSNGYVIANHGANADRLKNIEDLIGSENDDELTGNELDQFITGGEGNDTIDGAEGADTLDGGLGQDQVAGGSGDDLFVHSDGDDQLDGGADLDTIDFSLTGAITQIDATLNGGTESAIVVAGGDDLLVRNIENIVGTPGDDKLQGDSSDNVLDGRGGDDTLIGAAGNDSLIGGEGRDSADYSVATVGVNIDLSAGEVTNDGFGGVDSIDGIEDLTGSEHNDILSGDAQDNILRGGAGNDVLTGRAGDDLLAGGEGLDTASYKQAGSAVSVDLAATVPTMDGEGGQDTFDSIESVIGSAFNDTLRGDEGSNTLSGLDGDDLLNGREGNDTLLGGSGNDTHLASSGTDSHDGGLGTDILDYSGFADAEAISVTLLGSDYAQVTVSEADNDQIRNVENVIGTSGDDFLTGDALANTLRGEGGNDTIRGGAGSDALSGGEGDDQLRFDDLTDEGVSLSLATNTASYATDGSVDTFSGFERYATTNQNDAIQTSEAADFVEGLGGDDRFFTSSGNDEFFGGSGQDVVDYSQDADIDHIEATLDEGNTITINVFGGDDDQITAIESVIGSVGADLLTGDTRDNILSGAGGDDLLDGAAGDDTLLGEAGQDRFLSGLGNDTYEGGAGIDVIDFSGAAGGISVDLGLNTASNDGYGDEDTIRTVENIIGTSDNDIIVGDGTVNVLVGSGGDDVIRGGIGSDTLDGGEGLLDEVHFDDLVNSGVTLDLDAGTAFHPGDASTDVLVGFELYFTTNQNDQIRGSEAADTVFGLAGDDVFSASSGADFLDGGADSDSLDFSALQSATAVNLTLDGARTVVVLVEGVGSQSVANIENVTGTGGADVLGGDALSNTLIAGAGNDSVFGGAGSDVLEGGVGTDELRFDELGAVGITLTLGEGLGTATYAPDNSTDTFSGFERYLTTLQDDDVRTSSADDEVFTLAGSDQIEASLGADTIDGGLGDDYIDYSGLVGVSGIQVALDNAIPVQVVVDGAEDDTISNIENVIGTDSDDTISGDGQQNKLVGFGGADVLSGNGGDDQLLGGLGDDRLRGGSGNDILDGAQGRDTASYTDATGGVAVNLSTGVATNDGFGGSDALRNIENVEGSDFADLLRGSRNGNDVDGGAGDDVIYGGLGSDNLTGGAHVSGDTLRFDDLDGAGIQLNLGLSRATFSGDLSVDTFSGFERYIGTQQSDTLLGSTANDVVNMLGGDDALSASAGSDDLDGGAGSDTLDYSELTSVSGLEVRLNGTNPVSVTVAGGDNDTIANIENLKGSTGNDVLGGDASDNQLEGMAGSDQFSASAGADTLIGGEGSDTLDYSSFFSASSIAVTLQGDTFTSVAVVGSANDTVSGIENIIGTAGNDVITGDDEDNTLEGRFGSDTLNGGGGSDTVLGGDGADTIIGGEGVDTTDGGAGLDTIDYSRLPAGQSLDVALSGGTDASVIIAGGDKDTVRNVENVIATSGSDRVIGDAQQNILQTLAGDDVLGASAGSDTLDGGLGVDTADYSVLAGVQRITVALDGSNATTVQVSGGSDDQILRVENVIGTDGDDSLTGDSQNNRLQGGLGNDTLAGAAGDDVLDGGAGVFVDSVSYADATTGVTVDLVSGITSEDGYGSVDTLINIEAVTGSDQSDDITTAAGTQSIQAGAGDDEITLGLGVISVDGGTGSDTADYSALSSVNAISVELNGLNAVTLSVVGSTDHTLIAIENITGSQGNDVISGDSNDNTLDGGAGNDILQGLGGNDNLFGGVGTDEADYSQAGSGVDVDLRANRARNDGELGSDTLSGIENLSGSSFDDVLSGDIRDNVLTGNSGDDTLDGRAGTDTLLGGGGADQIIASEGADITDGGTGVDTIDFTRLAEGQSINVDLNVSTDAIVTITGGTDQTIRNVENVIGTGEDDQITGDAQENDLQTLAGDDVLGASGGADTLDGGSGVDTVDYSSLVGVQRIFVSLNGSTTSTVQVSGGADDQIVNIENVIGTAGNDTLTGDSQDNYLEGRLGDDTLIGAGGNDVLDGGAGASDTVDYSAAPNDVNIDLAAGLASADGYLAVDTVLNVENVVGSANEDTIAGSDAANVLDAGAGDDVLSASAGSDDIDGGTGSDTLDYSDLTGVTGISAQLNGASTVTVTVGGGDNDTVISIENLVGSTGDDVLGGDNNANRLEGLGGSDRFLASAGVDDILGGDGSDTIDYSTLSSASAIAVTLQDTAPTTVIVTGSDNDTIASVENIVGTFGDDTLTGDAQDNTLEGRAGNDMLNGGAGDDTLLGGSGTDQVTASEGADITDGGAGVDTVDFSALAAGQSIDVELNDSTDATVTIAGGTDQTIRNVENIIGTDANDQITGDAQENNLQTLAGDDVLGASSGADILDGGSGVDTVDYSSLEGIQRINVALSGSSTSTVQVSGGTNDLIVNIENVIGTAGNDTLTGDSQDNRLEGRLGDDTLIGAGGNDMLDGGAGASDTVDYSAAPNDVNIDLAAGLASEDGYLAVDTVLNVENVIGSANEDTIAGSGAANVLDAGAGDDALSASAGSDDMDGGAGSDTLDYSRLTGVSGVSATLNGASTVTVTVDGGDNDTISNIENLVGSTGDDVLGGDNNANRLEGLAGSDRFIASAGVDDMVGGEGSDTVDYSSFFAAGDITVSLQGASQTTVLLSTSDNDTIAGVENVIGSFGDDTLIGDAQNNTLEGRGGNDTLDGGSGADTLLGGSGTDQIIASEGADITDGGADVDTVDFSALAAGQSINVELNESADATVTIAGGTDQTIRNVENLIGTGENDRITGDAQENNLQTLAGDDVLGASQGSDTLDGGAGSDTVDYSTVAGVQRITLTLDGSNTTTVQVSGGADDQIANIENVVGTAGNDTLTGDSQNNRLEGGLGNDVLIGAAGNDILDGGTGVFVDSVSYIGATGGIVADLSTGNVSEDGFGSVDILIDIEELTGSNQADAITAATDTQRIDAKGGDDDIILGLGSIDVDGGAGSDSVDYSVLPAVNAISVELDGSNTVVLSVAGSTNQSLTAVENVTGGQGDDVITGDNNDNTLEGGVGDDTLQGSDGDDTLIGGSGSDTADYSKAGGSVVVDLQIDEATDDGDGGTDNLSSIENLSGSNFDDVLIGNASDNTLDGNAGADTLRGGAGVDVLDGGTGRDTAEYSAATGVVSVDLASNVARQDGYGDSDTLQGIEDVIGSNQNDTILGDANDNALDGGLGDDLLRGGGGFDTLTGGAGTGDTADYSLAAGQVVVDLTSNSASNDGDGSFDTLSGIENVTGSDQDDRLTGDSASNRLQGGDGADVLIGAGNNDVLDGGGGLQDTVDYSAAPNSVNIDLSANSASQDGYLATDIVLDVENVVGSSNDDVMTGDAAANTLDSGAGNDDLYASTGSDSIDGGSGSDTLDYSGLTGVTGVSATLNGASDVLVTVGGGDNDTISNIENLVGSEGDDVLGGDISANRLEGLNGDDRFIASAGIDDMIGGDGSDTVDYSTFASASAIAVTLQGATQSTVVVTGSDNDTIVAVENVVGTAGDDALSGDDADNTLDGRAGSDTLDGGLGDDTLLGGAGADQITASEGADTTDGGSGVDTIDFSQLVPGQSIEVVLDEGLDATVMIDGGTDQTIRSVENLVGSGGDDIVTGDAQQNLLQTRAGDDVIGASGGSDTLDGGAGTDTVDYSALVGVQRISVALNGSSTTTVQVSGGTDDQVLNIENVIGTQGNDTLIGDAQNNRLEGGLGDDALIGNAGNDILDGGTGAFVDSVSYIDAPIGVTANLVTGIVSEDGFGDVDTLADIEALTGSNQADTLTAAATTQRIDAEGGDDDITLGLGTISIDGGAGSDTADYSALLTANAISVELDGQNSVTLSVNGSTDHTLTAVENVTGSQGDDVLTGDGNDNTLDGGIGNDTLQGLGGDDNLVGGAGVDEADYSQSGAAVNVDLQANEATDDGEGGTDTLSGIENLAGSNFNDVLRGDSSDNALQGNAGDDTLRGGAGLDILDGGAGTDIADYSAVGGIVSVDLANSEASLDGDGDSDTLLRIENVVGSDQNDILIGDAADNALTGGSGDDLLRGAGGFDTLTGGGGTGDTADYTLAAGQVVVNLAINNTSNDGDGSFDTLSGIENVLGSMHDDLLTGDSGINSLQGGEGADTLIGAGSNDDLDGGAGLSDTVDYSAAPNSVNIDLAAQRATADGYLAVDTVTNVENVTGSAQGDAIAGDSLANALQGGAGNDVLTGRAGDDILDGGVGIDTASYADAAAGVSSSLNNNQTTDDGDGSADRLIAIENLTGSDFADNLSGNFQSNRLDGGDGDDVLRGAGGQDELIGGLGINTANYSAASAAVNVNLTAGQASLDGDGSSDTLTQIQNVTGTVFDDTLVGDTANNHLIGGSKNDVLEGRGGVDILDGGAGTDTVHYGLAPSAVVVNLADNETTDDGYGATDSLVLIENVSGSAGADTITGNGVANVLFGDAGDDTLVGAAGNDTLDGGADTDRVDYSAASAGVRASIATGTTTNDGDGGTDTLSNVENLTGSAFDDVLEGDSGSNELIGGDGDDEFAGFAGNDTIEGGPGVNTVDYSAATAAVVVDLEAELATDDGFGFVDTLDNIQNVTGSTHDDAIAGDASNNQLLGGDGDDTIVASSGNDFIDGAQGTDTADYSTLVGIGGVTVALNGAVDVTAIVQGGDNDTLSGIENLVGSIGSDDLAGDSSINDIHGGAEDDVIRGGSGSDVLDGGTHVLGDELRFDELNGVGIALNLVSGTASFAADGSTDVFTNFESYVLTQQADSVISSAGDDSVNSLGGDDVFSASQGADSLDGGQGSDSVDYSGLSGVSAVNIALTGAVASIAQVVGGTDDTLTSIENITASAGDDSLIGDDEDNTFQALGGDDTLDGGDGRDQLSGGAGDDSFIASDGQNTYDGGADTDTVDYSSLSGITSIDATLAGTSTTTITVSGGSNDFAVAVENLIGSTGNDTLTGDGFANRLEGSEGNDTLEGRGGADVLVGGIGIDTIDYSSFGPGQGISVALNGGAISSVTVSGDGTDTVSEVENVVGSGGDDIIIGDTFANVLEGTEGADTLVGGAGADTLSGGEGSDTVDYSQETGINFVSVQLNGGNAVSVTVDGADDDTLVAVENVIGTEGDDTLYGGGSVNNLDGRGGNDLIRGGVANDTLDGGTGIDTLSFSDSGNGVTADMANITGGFFSITHSSGEIDTATNFTNLIGSGGNDVMSGDAADNQIEGSGGQDQISGAGGDDILLGGDSDDILDGGTGDDQLDGGAGDDVLTGGDGADTINAGTGKDTINAGNGADVIDGGAEEDLLDYSVHAGATAISVILDEGTPATVTVSGSTDDTVANVEQIIGTEGADSITGDASNNTFWGEAGDDILAGGLGTNVVYGGTGQDIFLGTGGQNTYYGGADSDTVDYSMTAEITSVEVDLSGDSLSVAELTGITNDLLAEIENVVASSGNDRVHGDDRDNHLQTLAGNDELYGDAGVDILDGGAGSDRVNYWDAAAGVVVDLQNDEATDDGDGGTDIYIDIENIYGSNHADSIIGDDNNNELRGRNGDDVFIGGSGVDTLYGDDGSDTVDYSTQAGVTGVAVRLSGSSFSTVSITGDDDDSIRDIENVIGSSGDDVLAGDTLDNHLQGLGGNDLLSGAQGDDILDGGTGINTVTYDDVSTRVVTDMNSAVAGSFTASVGTSGEVDTLINIANLSGSTVGDNLTGDDADNILNGNGGNDILIGGDGVDTITGGSGNDRIDGGLGDDILMGGGGNYDLFIDSEGSDSYDGGSGLYDRIDYGRSPGVSAINIVLDRGNVTTVDVTGGNDDTIQNIEFVLGTSGDDSFTGDNTRNDFYGRAGDDSFFGSVGNDRFFGEAGDDIADYSSFTAAITGTMNTGSFGRYNLSKAGSGSDTLTSVSTLLTGSGNDEIVTGIDTILLHTNGGDDEVRARYPGVSIETGAGQDTVEVEASAASIDTGDDRDRVQVDASGATVVLGAGDDTLETTGVYAVTADGGLGNDLFELRGGGSDINGGDQIDTVDYLDSMEGITAVLNDTGNSSITVAGEPADTVRNVESISGTNLADSIAGNSADNTFLGRGGDDSFIGSDGADVVTGGAGNDTIDYSGFGVGSAITVVLDQSNDITLSVNGRADQTLNSIENITGSAGNDTLTGDAFDNILDGSAGNDYIYGSSGDDVLRGGAGTSDVLDYGSFVTSLTINFEAGTALDGNGFTDRFSGFEQYVLTEADDTIRGSSAVDTLSSGGGSDYFYASADADVLDGGTDIDTLDYSSRAIASLSVTLNGSNPVTVNVNGGANDTVQGFENLTGSIGGDSITGDTLDNVLSGSAGNDVLDGRAGDDTINGDAGDDTLMGSEGADNFDGGADIDVLDYSTLSGTTGVTLDLDGVNVVTATVAGGINDTVANVENVIGSTGDDALTGDAGANTLTGGFGADTLTGDAGSDVLAGNAGDDILDGGRGLDTLTGGAGLDDLSGGDGDDTLDGGADDDTLAGGNDDDQLTGGAGDDTLDGNAGNDTMDGGTGTDLLSGGTGNDVLAGGSGADTVSGDEGDDQLLGGDGADVFDGGDDVDTLDYSVQTSAVSVNLTLDGANPTTATIVGDDNDTVSNVENVIGTDGSDLLVGDASDNVLTGSAGNDTLDGAGGNDSLDGGTGNDTLTGGAGNDTVSGGSGDDQLVVGEGLDNLDGGADTDTVDYSLHASATAIDITLNGAVATTVSITGSDNDIVRNVENITGTSGADTINGDASDNVLTGGAGNDQLSGGAGSDTFNGGADVDTLDYSSHPDALSITLTLDGASVATVAVSGSDNDTVRNVENIQGTSGSDDITGDANDNELSGDDGNDQLTGMAGADTLSGGTGDDTLSGGEGNDTMSGGAGADLILSGEGQDVINGGADVDTLNYSSHATASAISVTLNADIATTVIVSNADNDIIRNVENITGTNGADTLVGDSNANLLAGSLGDDQLTGLGGIDRLEGGGGVDTLLGGADNDTLSGGTDNDILQGDAGDDTLFGDEGNDSLKGGAGSDTLFGGNGIDTADYSDSADGITGGLVRGTSGTIDQGLETDTISAVEQFILSAQDDLLSFDMDALAAAAVDARGGNDTAALVDSSTGDNLTDANIEGIDLAAVFTDVENIDFTNTGLTSGDIFDIGNSDISSITGGGNSLSVSVNQSTMGLAQFSVLDQGGAAVSSDITSGNTRTVDWDNGVQLILNG